MEEREIDVLIEKGVQFEVEQTYWKREEGFLGFFKKPLKVTERVKYTIQEPTLSTLDRLASEQVKLNIDENALSSEKAMVEARSISLEQSERMARIIAIVVLGEDYYRTVQHGNAFRYQTDDVRLNELTEIFFHFVKPSKLMQLALLINSISNLADFINSIRLMSASRTTMPNLIEEAGA